MWATAVVAISSQPALQPDSLLKPPLRETTLSAARKNSQWGRQWIMQPGGLNCYDGHGAPGASGRPHSTSIRLDECEKECRALPGCKAVVVKFESADDRVLAAAGNETAAALVDCYLREEVHTEDCIRGSDGYELFMLDSLKVWRQRHRRQQQQQEDYLTPKDASTCVSNNPRSIDSWCRSMCERGACTADMCVCDGEAATAGQEQPQLPQPQQRPPTGPTWADAHPSAGGAASDAVQTPQSEQQVRQQQQQAQAQPQPQPQPQQQSSEGEDSVKAQAKEPDAEQGDSRAAQTGDRRSGRQWIVQPGGLNCYDGRGAPGARGCPG